MTKNLFLLFLLLPAATQCMEQEIVTKPKTMQEIRDDRDAIYQKRLDNSALDSYPLDAILFQEHWAHNLKIIKEEQGKKRKLLQDTKDFSIMSNPDWYKTFTEHGYSFLGIATIAIKSERPLNENSIQRGKRKKELLNKKNPEQVPFKEKKEHIQELLALSFEPNKKDNRALLAMYEEHGSSLIQQYCFLKHSPILSEIEIPREILHYIAVLMFNTELFQK